MQNKKVSILFNKLTENPTIDELDVIEQVETIEKALKELGYESIRIPFSFNIDAVVSELKRIAPIFAVNLVEAIDNDGQLICFGPSILDYLKIPYTGCTKEAIFITSNKVLTKKIMAAQGVKTPEWVTLEPDSDNTFIDGERYILKAIWEDASICLEADSVVKPESIEHLRELIQNQNNRYKKEFFAERYIHGRDLSTSVLAGKSLSTREFIFSEAEDEVRVVGYKAKWDEDSEEFKNSDVTSEFAPEDKDLVAKTLVLSEDLWKKLNLNGYARVDFRVDDNREIYVLEVNANPCISPDTAFVRALDASGITFTQAMKQIIDDMKIIYTK